MNDRIDESSEEEGASLRIDARSLSVQDVERLARLLLSELPPESGALVGIPAKRFLGSYWPAEVRARLPEQSAMIRYMDGGVLVLGNCPPALEEAVISTLEPLDFARGPDGSVAFLWVVPAPLGMHTEARLAEMREAYRRERAKYSGRPVTWEDQEGRDKAEGDASP
jgi:hypothetical protein